MPCLTRPVHEQTRLYSPTESCSNIPTLKVIEMRTGFITVGLLGIYLMSITLPAQAAPARYYKWQGADRVICAQTAQAMAGHA